MEKIAIKVTSAEQGRKVIEYLESLGGYNTLFIPSDLIECYYYIQSLNIITWDWQMPEGYTEGFLPEEWKPTEQKLPKSLDPFRAKAALMCLSFYEVEDEERFSKAVRDADELIKELNK